MLKSTMPIKSIITGRIIPLGDFEESWQEFAISRQELIEDKLNSEGLSSNYLRGSSKLGEALEQIKNKELIDEIWEAIWNQQATTTYMHYNKGFLDGIKFAIMAEKL